MADEPTYRSNQPIGNPQGITENSPDASQEVAQRGLFDTYQTGILDRMIELTRDQNPDWDYVYADSETPIPIDYPMDTILNVAAAAGGGIVVDRMVAVSAADPIPDELDAKIAAGAGIGLAILNPGINEQLEITCTVVDTDIYSKVSVADTTSSYLNTKINVGAGLSKAIGTPGGNETLDLACTITQYTNHNILSASHPDSTVAAAVRGDIITAQGVGALWTRLAAGAVGDVLTMGATEPGWAAPGAGTDIYVKIDAADTTAGYLDGKLIDGTSVVWAVNLDGGNKTMNPEVANDAITFAKMQNIATDSLIGRDTALAGDPENITLGTGLAMSGAGVLNCTLAGVPSGVIVMWFGLIAAIPAGWTLCDGTAGTPDLRDYFVKGASAGNEAVGGGGAATHTHAAHVFTQANAHSNHVFTQPNAHSTLTHTTAADSTTSGGTAKVVATTHTISAHAGGAVDAHSAHAGGAVDAHDTPNSEPPYLYTLFIMKT